MEKAVIDTSRLAPRRRGAGRPKGRQVDPAALAEVRTLLGDSPRRRDLLIELNETEGLRVILSGLAATDRIVIDGLQRARPGQKVTPEQGRITPLASP